MPRAWRVKKDETCAHVQQPSAPCCILTEYTPGQSLVYLGSGACERLFLVSFLLGPRPMLGRRRVWMLHVVVRRSAHFRHGLTGPYEPPRQHSLPRRASTDSCSLIQTRKPVRTRQAERKNRPRRGPVEHWMPPGARRLIGQTAHLRHQKAVSSIEAPEPIKAAQPPKSCNRKRPCLRLRGRPVSRAA